jgi:integrase
MPARAATVNEAVAAYLKFISAENAAPHVANKVSILRRFLGAARVESLGGPAKTKRKRLKGGKTHVPDPRPFFTGQHMHELTPAVLQNFIEEAGLGRVSMRHYRTFFHHFFAVCLKLDLYHPTNWHRPNPAAALPGYASRNRRIVYLTETQVQEQLNALSEHPALRIAAAIMIYAGVRRSEALWLARDAISKDLSYLSVINRVDMDSDIESSLKTGERTVTILPPLREELQRYLATLDSDWIIPNQFGRRWRPDSFTGKLRGINRSNQLKWNCLTFRHTYATQRAAEGWPLFRIAKEMGNSVTIVERYYAGFIRPNVHASTD